MAHDVFISHSSVNKKAADASRGQNIDISSLSFARFLNVKVEPDKYYDKWLVGGQVEFALKDKKKLATSLKMDSVDFFGLDDFGVIELNISDIGAIDFMC